LPDFSANIHFEAQQLVGALNLFCCLNQADTEFDFGEVIDIDLLSVLAVGAGAAEVGPTAA